MLRRVTASALLTAALLGAATAQGEEPQTNPTAEQAFYRGFYFETAMRDLEKATARYSEAIELASKQKKQKILVKALIQNGLCLQKLGRADEARASFEKAVTLDPENRVAREALAKRRADQDELGLRITALVAGLGGQDRQRAYNDLRLLGATAVPYLARALASRDIGIVSQAAQLLARTGKPGAEALARGLGDPKVLFHERLVQIEEGTEAGLIVAAAALAHDDADIRLKAAVRLSVSGWERPELEQKFVEVIRALVALEDPAPMRALIRNGHRLPVAAWSVMAPRLTEELRSGDIERQRLGLRAVNFTLRRVDMPREFWVAGMEAAAAILASSPDVKSRQEAGKIIQQLDATWTKKTAEYAIAAARAEFANPVRDVRVYPRLESFASSKSAVAVDLTTRLDLMDEACSASSKLTEDARSKFTRWIAREAWRDVPADERAALLRRGLRELSEPVALREWVSAGWSTDEWSVWAQAADHPARVVRAIAYEWIRNHGERVPDGAPAPKYLSRDLAHEPGIRKYAWEACKHFNDPSYADGLRAYISGLNDNRERARPLQHLAKIIGKAAAPDLERHLLTSTDQEVIWALADVMGTDAAPRLIAVAKEYGMLQPVMGPLRAEKYEPLVKLILQTAPQELIDSHALGMAARVLDDAAFKKQIVRSMDSRNGRTRASACRWAGIKRLDSSWSKLLQLLEDDDSNVRKNAKAAIDEIRWFQDVKAGLTSDDRSAAIAKARELAKSGVAAQRRGAAFALAALKDQAAIPTLLELLEDSDATVQEAAVSALQALGAATKKK